MDTNLAHRDDRGAPIVAIEADIREGRLELPLLPNVATEVVASSVDERSDAVRLAGLIQQDQTLATHVLKVVNSPAFRGAQEIVALQQAIARLGMDRIREIALSASVRGTLFRDGPYQARADLAWRQALAAGLWAKEVARAARKNVEIAYLCGLLHDIGTPLVLHRLGEVAPDLDDPHVEAVLERLSATAGGQLAMAWSLPEAVPAVIRHLHEPDTADPAHGDTVAVVSCSVCLARQTVAGALDVPALGALPVFARLNLYPEDVEELAALEDRVTSAVESMVL